MAAPIGYSVISATAYHTCDVVGRRILYFKEYTGIQHYISGRTGPHFNVLRAPLVEDRTAGAVKCNATGLASGLGAT